MRTARAWMALLLTLAMTVVWRPDAARGCTCGPEATLKEAAASSDLVFAGRVTNVAAIDPPVVPAASVIPYIGYVVTFEVRTMWKGARSDTVDVWTPHPGSACGYAFAPGQDYLVYARRQDLQEHVRGVYENLAPLMGRLPMAWPTAQASFTATTCTWTKPAGATADEEQALDKLFKKDHAQARPDGRPTAAARAHARVANGP